MSLLGTIDRPGGFRHKAPFPRGIPPLAKTPKGPEGVKPDTPLGGLALGWPGKPDDLFIDDSGKPVRIDKAFSWEYPLPFFYAPLEVQATDTGKYPLSAITQRPMAMYHSWDSQNAWLRQIHSHNYLFINNKTAILQGIADADWIWVESMHGRVRIYKAAPDEPQESWPQFEAMKAVPGTSTVRRLWQAYVAGKGVLGK